MISNYLKIAWRNLIKNPSYTFINIFGLTLGIGSFVLIGLYLYDEWTFDGMHSQGDHIYRVVEKKVNTNNEESEIAATSYQLSVQGVEKIPGIEATVRLVNFGRATVENPSNPTNGFYEDMWLTNQSFLDVFDFELLEGDRLTALVAPKSALLTEELAIKLFNTKENLIGKAIAMDRDTVPYTITGILKNFPINSHLDFNVLYSESSLTNIDLRNSMISDWSSNSFNTYFKISESSDPLIIESEMNAMVEKNTQDSERSSSFRIQPLKEIHFNSENIEASLGKSGSKRFTYILSLIGVFVLLIACINYMNLSTARFSSRRKEMAVRKVTGASKKNLIVQFLFEALFITHISSAGAFILVQFVLPSFNQFTTKELTFIIDNPWIQWGGMISLILGVGLISGLYPALIQANLKPKQLLVEKGNINIGGVTLRKGLVIFQFIVSIVMIAATMVVYKQLQFLKNTDMGFNKEHLMVMDINSGLIRSRAETVCNELSKIPSVKQVSVSSRVPGEWKQIPKVNIKSPGSIADGAEEMYFMGVDEDFLSTFEMELVTGSNFEKNNPSDSFAIIINETAAKLLGIASAENQIFEIPSSNFYGNIRDVEPDFNVRVKGIIKDFNYESLSKPIAPIVLANTNNPIHRIDYFTVRLDKDFKGEDLTVFENAIHSVDPNHLFEYHFLDDQWEIFYAEDKRRHTMIITASILSILIACLGLFGLAAFTAQQRIKEIGIRKVLGASTFSITTLLAKDFIRNVIISIVIAMPIAYYIMSSWLENFAFRISFHWWFFIIPGFVAIIIALTTVSLHTVKASIANPIKNLRSE